MAIYDFFVSRNGSVSNTATYVGHKGRLFYDSTNGVIKLSDGVTPGGYPLALESAVTGDAQAAFDKANVAYDTANSAYAAANNVAPQIQPAFDTANAAFAAANTNPLTQNFPTFPLGLITDAVNSPFGEHIAGIIYDMKVIPDGNIRIVDAGTI